jgi:mono/diheme cytochrome c family protein
MNPEDQQSPPASPALPSIAAGDRDEGTDVTCMHVAIMREKEEPKEGHEPISLWLITFIGALFFWGGLYLQRYSGNYEPLVYNEHARLSVGLGGSNTASNAPLDPVKLGRRVYLQVCQTCHQENGLGVAGQYPPLNQSEWVQAPGAGRLIRIVLNGLSGPVQVAGKSFDNVMPAWRDTLSDAEIAAALTFIRQEWNNKAPEVKPEQVKAIREATQTRGTPGLWTAWTAAELLAVPDTE